MYNLLDYGGESCNKTVDYSKDLCIYDAIQQDSLETVGCTNPFGPTKSQICGNENEGKNVSQIYNNAMKDLNYGGCSNPCSFLTIKKTDEVAYSNGIQSAPWSANVTLNFEKIIRVTEGYYAYTGLNLFAEIGGYIGLLLGVSLNQVTNIVDSLAAKLTKF